MNTKRSASESSEPLTNKRLKSLVIPKRKKPTSWTPKPVVEIPSQQETYSCPFCAEVLVAPYPRKVKRKIDIIKKNEREYHLEKKREHEQLVIQCRLDGLAEPPFFYQPTDISSNDKKAFCRTHKVELIFKPMAKERGYPDPIDFGALPSRIQGLEESLAAIIHRDQPSSFLDLAQEAFERLGNKARDTKQVIQRFQLTLPGYYGQRGSQIMMDTLSDMFVKPGLLTAKQTEPLTAIEFVQQVLVPECGLRLIQEDAKVSLERAKEIMKESEAYGSTVHYK